VLQNWPQLYEETNKKVHPDILRRVLKESGYNGRVACKKPFINKANRKKKLIFAKEFISKEQIWWNDVILADKSKFNIFGQTENDIAKSKRRIQTEKFEANYDTR